VKGVRLLINDKQCALPSTSPRGRVRADRVRCTDILLQELTLPFSVAFEVGDAPVIPPTGTLAHRGYTLFLLNCVHCHGTDARAEEGPDLHGITKSDARIASLIQNGIKGQTPKFGAKLSRAKILS